MTTLNIHERRIGDVTILDMDGNIRIGGANVALQKGIHSHLTQRLHELMTIIKLLTIFDVYDDESEAVDSFKIRDAVAVPAA